MQPIKAAALLVISLVLISCDSSDFPGFSDLASNAGINGDTSTLNEQCLIAADDNSSLPDSSVVLSNNTLQTLTLNLRIQHDCVLNEGEDYELLTTELAPLATQKLLSFSRSRSLKQGYSYSYHIDVSNTDSLDTITLTQTVESKIEEDSLLSIGASGSGFHVVPQSDWAIQRHATQFSGLSTLAFNAEDTGTGEQINYVIHNIEPKPNLDAANELNILSYNAWITSLLGSQDIDARVAELPSHLSGYDVMVGIEYFDDAPVANLRTAIKDAYPYQTSSGDIAIGKFLPAGTYIFSRWPIEHEEKYYFNACDGFQCFSTRAVIYTQINKHGNRYHVFATHLQSSSLPYNPADRTARLAQIQEMAAFVQSQNIPAGEAVIFAGDFNVDKIALPADRDSMLTNLQAVEPSNLGFTLSFDSDTNYWAEQPYKEYIDYTLHSSVHLIPVSATQKIIAPRSLSDALWKKWDLSDHYAALGEFNYDSPASPVRPEFPYIGNVVHIKTNDEFYLSSSNTISASSDTIGTEQSFHVEARPNNKIALRAHDKRYLGLDGFDSLSVLSDTADVTQEFELTELVSGKVAFKANNGLYLSSDLNASANSVSANESFTLTRP